MKRGPSVFCCFGEYGEEQQHTNFITNLVSLRKIISSMRYFNTSGPNITAQHYTLMRPQLVAKGLDKVHKDRYFTIWAPRQTGKSTYFRLLADQLF